MDFWYPDDDAPIDPNWWAPLMRFGLAAARNGLPALDPEEFMFMGRVVRKGRPDLWRSAWWHLDLIDFSPALQPDRSNKVFVEPPADESDWSSDEISAA